MAVTAGADDGAPMLLIPILVPMFVWMWLPDRWHRAVGFGFAALAVVYAVGLVVTLIRVWMADAVGSSAGHYRWKRGVAAADYARALRLHLGIGGWRVDAATVMDPAHVLVLAHKDRDRVALLCRHPSEAVTPIEAMLPTDAHATRLLIVDKPSRPPEQPYAVLKDLAAAITAAPGI